MWEGPWRKWIATSVLQGSPNSPSTSLLWRRREATPSLSFLQSFPSTTSGSAETPLSSIRTRFAYPDPPNISLLQEIRLRLVVTAARALPRPQSVNISVVGGYGNQRMKVGHASSDMRRVNGESLKSLTSVVMGNLSHCRSESVIGTHVFFGWATLQRGNRGEIRGRDVTVKVKGSNWQNAHYPALLPGTYERRHPIDSPRPLKSISVAPGQLVSWGDPRWLIVDLSKDHRWSKATASGQRMDLRSVLVFCFGVGVTIGFTNECRREDGVRR